MKRESLCGVIADVKRKRAEVGHPIAGIGLSKFDMLAMSCTHVHGLELVKVRELKRGQFIMFDRAEDGSLQSVKQL